MQASDPDSRLKVVRSGFDKARAHRDVLDNRLSVLEKEVGEAKFRLSLKDEVDDIMLGLQEHNHKRTVGMYEGLLTQILREVLNNRDKAISMELGTRAGKPTLDIMVKKGNDLEDVMTGSGGSVANIISAGLRFIALSRVDCRKFIVLDEADCWLSPDRVGQFSNVVAKMGEEMGVQSIMISHHDASTFYDAATTVAYLSRDPGTDEVRVEHHKQSQVHVGPKDIALIELRDFMSHSHTKIKIGPGMTVIHGANDIGKSAVVTALHAIAEASFKKDYVRHGAEAGFVRLTLGDGHIVELQRNVKGSPAMIYRLYEPDGKLAHESPVKNEVPGWAESIIGIRLEQDLDIQLGNQKRPVFLLDEPDSKKTAILSVGGELSHLVAMQEKYKTWVSSDKVKVKSGEAEVARLRDAIKLIDDFMTSGVALRDADQAMADSLVLGRKEVVMGAMLTRLAASESAFTIACEFGGVRVDVGDCQIVDAGALDKMLSGLRRFSAGADARTPELDITSCELSDVGALARVIAALRVAQGKAAAGDGLQSPDKMLSAGEVKVVDDGRLLSLIERMKARASTGKAVAQAEVAIRLDMDTVNAGFDALIEKLGGVCPVCSGEMIGVHAHA